MPPSPFNITKGNLGTAAAAPSGGQSAGPTTTGGSAQPSPAQPAPPCAEAGGGRGRGRAAGSGGSCRAGGSAGGPGEALRGHKGLHGNGGTSPPRPRHRRSRPRRSERDSGSGEAALGDAGRELQPLALPHTPLQHFLFSYQSADQSSHTATGDEVTS
ncbi:uncharacterized protein GJ701_007163 [Geothlypis trichas]